jgi:hypothetical protein
VHTGFDFAHTGDCLNAAQQRIFPEPNYDCDAFYQDPERRRILGVWNADDWAVALPATHELVHRAHLENVWCWALVEHSDGSRHLEGVVRDSEWAAEPGSFEFPEARYGSRAPLGYVVLTNHANTDDLIEAARAWTCPSQVAQRRAPPRMKAR